MSNTKSVLGISLFLLPLAFGQYYNISTIAGSGQRQFAGAGNSALNARLVSPGYVAADFAGNVFVSDTYYNQVYRIGLDGIITLVAGIGQQGFSGDNGPATVARLDAPRGLAVAPDGTLYIADGNNSRIRAVSPTGTITTYAGGGAGARTGDNGPATAAGLGAPAGLAIDSAGNLFVSQSGVHVVRRISASGTITTVAGNGTGAFSGDGGPATSASLFRPAGIKVDSTGSLYIADSQNHRIRRVSQGVISTVAGNGTPRFSGDGGPATSASINGPSDVAFDAANNLYITDGSNGRVRVVNAAGNISTAAGGGGLLTDGAAGQAFLPGLGGIAFDNNGGIVMALNSARQVRRLNIIARTIATLAGVLPVAGFGDNVAATTVPLLDPFGVLVDAAGNVYFSDQADNRVRKVAPTGIISTVAGTGIFGATGDTGVATNAQVGTPRGLALDAAGNLYIASGGGAAIRRVAPTGTITTYAGGNGPGLAGDGGPATAAQLLGPVSVAIDANGNLFISDSGSHRIRRVDAATRAVSTFAGTGIAGFAGDGGAAINAQLTLPRQLAFDTAGNLYIADTGNSRIRRITPAGVITTIAGTGVTVNSGDGGPAAQAEINSPAGIAIDKANNIYVSAGALIRKIEAATGRIGTIAGNGTANFSGDGALATNAALYFPQDLAVDQAGNVYIADTHNLRIRKLTPAQLVPEGVANGGTLLAGPVAPGEIVSIFGFNLGPATPVGLQLDTAGKVTTEAGGTTVLFDGIPAPIIYASANQVNVVVPYAVAAVASTRIQVNFQGVATNTITVQVTASSPGLFAITNQNGSVNSASNPAAQKSVIVLYGTGEGQTTPSGVDGQVNNADFPKPILEVTASVDGQPATVLYAGASPGFVTGVLQLNIQLPPGVTGNVPLQIKIGEATTPVGPRVVIR